MKRIIGMPGERIAIKSGYVKINGKILKEPYTLNNLPTFGNSFLSDCVEYTVPAESFVVMGDNRTVLNDEFLETIIHEITTLYKVFGHKNYTFATA